MAYYQQIHSRSAEQTQETGRAFAEFLITAPTSHTHARIVCLYGELGTGKTTFVRGFARGLGISGRIVSPTFVIIRRHILPGNHGFLYHLDLYRMQSLSDLTGLGLGEIFGDPDSFVAVEWAQNAGNMLPELRFDISFRNHGHDIHEIDIRQKNQ